MKYVLILSLYALTTSTAFSQTTYNLSVDVGDFCGYWRFIHKGEVNAENPIGASNCEPVRVPDDANGKHYYFGNCELTMPTTANIEPLQFQIKASHTPIYFEIGGSPEFQITPETLRTQTVTLVSDGTQNILTLNLATVSVIQNGFSAHNFEYISAPKGSPNACSNTNVFLPLDTTWNLSLGSAQLRAIHIDHQGRLYPVGTGSITATGIGTGATLELRTAEVTLTPTLGERATPWSIEGVVDTSTADSATFRLAMTGKYEVRFEGLSKSVAHFYLTDDCQLIPETLVAPGVQGRYSLEVDCSTILSNW